MTNYGVVLDSRPIMVSGVYRSGTTFLSAMLGAHAELKASSSTVKFLRFCLGKYGDMRDEKNVIKLLSDTHKRVKTRWKLDFDENTILEKYKESENKSYAFIYDLIMRNMLTDNKNNLRWVEKLAVQWTDIPYFLDMFPNGHVIHIYRDPRDVAASYKKMTFEPGYTYLDASFNFISANDFINKIDDKYKNKVFIVKAEDIAAKPIESAKDICAFLNIHYDENMIDANMLHAEGEDWASNTSYGKSYKQLPDAKSRWPSYLSRSEVLFIEMITQPYLSSLGYQGSGYFPTKQEWAEIYDYVNDPFIKERISKYLISGQGSQGYRTDPYEYEMKLVFPERY